jgi:hypothetical protein
VRPKIVERERPEPVVETQCVGFLERPLLRPSIGLDAFDLFPGDPLRGDHGRHQDTNSDSNRRTPQVTFMAGIIDRSNDPNDPNGSNDPND